MKKIIFVCLVTILLFACNTHSNGPDVSGIKVEIPIERFDQVFFSMDTIAPEKALSALRVKYPTLMPVYLKNILGLNEMTEDSGYIRFRRLNQFIADSVNKTFNNTDDLKKDFENAFRYVRYYFPGYKIPRIITIIGPIDLLAETANGELTPDFLGPDYLGISLQFYLGKNFSLYHDDYFIANVAPDYRSRRFEKNYIVADAMKLVVDDLFPDKSRSKGLIEQMIEKGKQWWLLDKFLPATPDSLKTGYTASQLKWCDEYEGLIWNNIITSEKNIYTNDPAAIQNYIGEAPFTQTMPASSPGNIGQWVGWQIVKKFAEKNTSMSISEVMKTEPRKILEEAKYKPK